MIASAKNTKLCRKCGDVKELDCFYRNKGKDGDYTRIRSWCKACCLAYQKANYSFDEHAKVIRDAWYKKNPDKVKKYRQTFLKKNPGYAKEYAREYWKKQKERKKAEA